MTKRKANPLPRVEIARLGGLALLKKYGIEYLRQIAKRGGEQYNKRYVAGGISGPIVDRAPDDDIPY